MKRILSVLFCILATTAICTAQSVLYFPQIAEGVQPGGIQWGMIIALSNPAAPGTAAASGTLTLAKDDGTLYAPINFFQYGNNTSPPQPANPLSFQLAGGQTTLVISGGYFGQSTYPLQTGFATVNSNLPLAGTVIFSEFGPAGRIAEAGVLSATPSTRQEIIALMPRPTTPNSAPSDIALASLNSGLALANPGTGTATITFQLLDAYGAAAAPTATRTLAANNHTAFFINQLFPNTTIGGVVGTLRILSDVPIVATALLFDNNGQFATFPVFPLR